MKYYKRPLRGLNSEQILKIDDQGRFWSIENRPLGPHITVGCCPSEFEVGKKPSWGFFTKFGFKRYYPSDKDLYHEILSGKLESGDFTTW